jgi:DNA-binding beta-propeller fold protein YncE
VIDTGSGQIVARFPSGDQPHENNYSRDGSLIYHASIGTVYDAVSAISYDTEQEVARIPVGDHPQRMRTGKLSVGLLGTKKR